MPITLDGSNGITQAGEFNSDSTFGFKNRIINGAMVIDQRNASASVTPSVGTYTLDRWIGLNSVGSKYTVQQNAGSVTPPAGFTNYLGVTSSSAYSAGSGDYFGIIQRVEGFNMADLAWGTANAKTVTLSFWVRSSLTGTFGGCLTNSAETYSYPYSYTISSANTWEQKSITITGATSGTWLTTNGIGIELWFSLGMGSTFSGTAGAWTASTKFAPTGATSVVGTNGATFYITGVQLEVGSTATSFDYRPYTVEQNLCYRYYQRFLGTDVYEIARWFGIAYSTTAVEGPLTYKQTMRSAPTLTSSTIRFLDGVNVFTGTVAMDSVGLDSARMYCTTSGLTQYRSYYCQASNSTNAYIALSAEL